MAKKKGGNTVSAVWQLAEPIVKELGLQLWDVRFVKEGTDWFLRIFIDKEGGIDLDDCETVTDLINDPLDELDPIAEAYFLEVSSPGVERHLKSMRHFEKAVGEKIRVKTFVKMENSKEWVGILKAVDENGITLESNGKTIEFPFEKIAKANISVF